MTRLRAYLAEYRERRLKKRFPELSQAFKIHSHLTTPERIQLYRLTKDRYRVLEIGSYMGASACCFGAAMQSSGRGQIICIDTWQNDAMSEGSRDTYSDFLKNTETFAPFIVPVRALSSEAVGQIPLQGLHVDLLFVDGDHSYAGVKADWEAYRGFLKTDAVIAFHDWGWAEGVQRVIREDVQPVIKDFDSLPNLWWGTLQ